MTPPKVVSVLAASLLAATGCSADPASSPEPAATVVPVAKASTPQAEPAACEDVGRLERGPLRLCLTETKRDLLSEFRVGGERLDVELPFPMVSGNVPGSWQWASVSPDGETILAQWSGECEVPNAFFVDARGGTPRPAAGPGSSQDPISQPSEGLGWTTDGRAIIFVPEQPGCGSSGNPGVFLVDPVRPGEDERIGGATAREPPPIGVSRTPRPAGQLRKRLRTTLWH